MVQKNNSEKRCFVICPIGEEGSVVRKRSDLVLEYVIKIVTEDLGYVTNRSDEDNKPGTTHVYFEKKLPLFKQGPVDLLLVPIAKDGTEDLNNPYCFEFKMVWMKGIKDNISGIKKDIDKLGSYEPGYSVAVLFSFDGGPPWVPYAHKGDMERLVKEVVAEIGRPVHEGQDYRIVSPEVEGKLKLLAWGSNSRD